MMEVIEIIIGEGYREIVFKSNQPALYKKELIYNNYKYQVIQREVAYPKGFFLYTARTNGPAYIHYPELDKIEILNDKKYFPELTPQ